MPVSNFGGAGWAHAPPAKTCVRGRASPQLGRFYIRAPPMPLFLVKPTSRTTPPTTRQVERDGLQERIDTTTEEMGAPVKTAAQDSTTKSTILTTREPRALASILMSFAFSSCFICCEGGKAALCPRHATIHPSAHTRTRRVLGSHALTGGSLGGRERTSVWICAEGPAREIGESEPPTKQKRIKGCVVYLLGLFFAVDDLGVRALALDLSNACAAVTRDAVNVSLRV